MQQFVNVHTILDANSDAVRLQKKKNAGKDSTSQSSTHLAVLGYQSNTSYREMHII